MVSRGADEDVLLDVVLDGDGLGLEVLIEGFTAQVLAEAGALHPTERGRHVSLVISKPLYLY